MAHIKDIEKNGFQFRVCNLEKGMIYPDFQDEVTFLAVVKKSDLFKDTYVEVLEDWNKEYLDMNKEERQRDWEIIQKNRKQARVKKSTLGSPGWIYLIYASTGEYKIGKTKLRPEIRFKQISKKVPARLDLVASIKTHNIDKDEKFLHGLFRYKRLKGEWFALEKKDVEYVAAGEWAWKETK